MAKRLLGIETEYAFTAIGPNGKGLERSEALSDFIALGRKRLRHLSGIGRGMFIPSGGRLYIDAGSHPEFCTPECTNPWDVVRYTSAGERILADLASELAQEPQFSQVMLFKCNIDYSGHKATWGCHESYLHRTTSTLLSRHIIPHLVSRIIYTGAGGFNPLSAGLEFTLSPRVAYLVAEESDSSTSGRGIYHTKDESLSSPGYHRLHVLCGESLCSHVAAWLKVAATSLVVAMIEAGLAPGDEVQLKSPLEAMRTFAADPQCKAIVESKNGKGLTAGMIQRHYLELAEAQIHKAFMPPWAEDVCRQWRTMLDRLRDGPESVATTLDWAIKLALYKERLQRSRQVAWESLPHWTHVLGHLHEALKKSKCHKRSLSVEFVLGPHSPIRDKVAGLADYLTENGLAWKGLGPFLTWKPRLLEIDTRFGQLGDDGIFGAMDRAGVLTHSLAGIDNIDHAINNPPSEGRARVRGEWIQRLAGNNGRYTCGWSMIFDHTAGRQLDLSDPFLTKGQWQEIPADHYGESLASEAAGFRQLMELMRAESADARRPRPRREFRTGDVVVIVEGGLPAFAQYVGARAIITGIGRDERGRYYRLNVDDGQWCWRHGNLRRPDQTQAETPPGT